MVEFVFPRDPKDAALIELAIAGRASHIISTDDDLLALMKGLDDAAKRFRQRLPNASIVTPEEFARSFGEFISGG